MSTNKPHKGLLKRMRISKTGKVKHKSANSKHLKSNKSANRLRRLNKDRYLLSSETKAMELLLFRRLRGKDQPRSIVRKSASPAERKAQLAANKEAAKKAPAGEGSPKVRMAAGVRPSRPWKKSVATVSKA